MKSWYNCDGVGSIWSAMQFKSEDKPLNIMLVPRQCYRYKGGQTCWYFSMKKKYFIWNKIKQEFFYTVIYVHTSLGLLQRSTSSLTHLNCCIPSSIDKSVNSVHRCLGGFRSGFIEDNFRIGNFFVLNHSFIVACTNLGHLELNAHKSLKT